jgi:glycosyltransferase involved in cell wall biosynthesis
LLLFLQKKKSLSFCSFLKKRTKRLLSIAASAVLPGVSAVADGTTRVFAVIPVLNEAGAIGPTVRRLPASVVDAVVVVDGGSTDGTVAEAEAAGAIVIVERRRGYGRACLTGAEHAAAIGASLLLFMDGDGADPVEQAAALIGPIDRGEADFVLADRTRGERDAGSMGVHQILAGRLIGLAVGQMTGVRYRDMSAFRAIRTADLQRLGMREMTYGWNLEMQIRTAQLGLRVREVALPYHCRVAGRSKVAGSVKGTLVAGQRILRTLFAVRAATRKAPFPSP